MTQYHVIAQIQANGGVQAHRISNAPNLSLSTHHVTMPVNDKMTALIWWPQRLPVMDEQSHNQLIVQSLIESFGGNK